MISYKDIIEVNLHSKNIFKLRLVNFLLNLQCRTFESLIPLNKGKRLIFNIYICKNNSLKILSKTKNKVKISLEVDSPYKVVLSYLLQIWSIINNSLIVHGGIYTIGGYNYILTGKGGVGKTHRIICSCLDKKQPFMGDDLVLLTKNKAYPIIRPLCIYPEHKNIKKMNDFISLNIKKRNVIFLKIKRKIFIYALLLFPKLDFLFTNSYEKEFSNSNWAYVPPKKIGLDVYLDLINISGIIALVKTNKKVIDSKNTNDIVDGTLVEFKSYERELNYLIEVFHQDTFSNYIRKKINFLNKDK